MRFIRISADVWVNMSEVESVILNENGTVLIQGRNRVYESTLPFEAILPQLMEKEKSETPEVKVNSPLVAETRPAW